VGCFFAELDLRAAGAAASVDFGMIPPCVDRDFSTHSNSTPMGERWVIEKFDFFVLKRESRSQGSD
jgi:hypothetical protein